MSEVSENLAVVRTRISEACARAGRGGDSVELIAVSKTFPQELVLEAFRLGQRQFGESRIQEAEPKITALPGSLEWHFIGGIQRNKVRRLLQSFDVIHSIDSLRLAAYTDEIADELGIFPRVFVQVNIGGEPSKGGYAADALRADMENLLKFRRLELIGLMCIPPSGPDAESARPWFAALRELRDVLEVEFGVSIPALSMGMSGDYEIAIEEGSTHIRVGSSIFGRRSYRVNGELA